jgi:polysaccharide export outer membrane protein
VRLKALAALLVVASLALAVIAAAQESAPRDSGYRVGPGDTIKVNAYTHSEISGEFSVEGSGDISYPLLGEVVVAGKTTGEIGQLLERLLEKDFYVDVQLTVEVSDYRSQPVIVVGEVQRPGTYYLKGRTLLTDILSELGGLHEGAGRELELRRVIFTADGETQEVHTFTVENLLAGGEGSDVELRTGDVIKVLAKQVFFMTGEVASPGQYESRRGLTLMQAISQAGGLGKFASQSIEVHREGEGKKEILTYDLANIRKGKIDDPPVLQGDVVIVRRRFF